MTGLLDYAPITATCFAVPQFLPQIRKLATTGDTAGVSWSWATLTSVNNAARITYFTLARYPTALIPSSSPASCHHPGTGLDAHLEVYSTLNGASESQVIGPFKDSDITGELAGSGSRPCCSA